MDQDINTDYQEPEVYFEEAESPLLRISKWAKYIAVLFGIILPGTILLLAPGYRYGVSLFAYLNCIIYGCFMVYFLKKGTLGALIPVLTLMWVIVGSCLGIIFFAMLYPDETYPTPGGSVSFFAGGIRYQFSITLFMLSYFICMGFFLHKENSIIQHPRMVSRKICTISIYLVVFAVTAQIVLAFLPVPMFLGLWVGRLFVRYQSLLFVAGVGIAGLSMFRKMWLTFFLGIMVIFFAVKNARAMAMIPVLAFFCGLFFFSELKNRTKLNLALVTIVAMPLFLIISNTSRVILGPGSSEASIEQRAETFKHWKSVLKESDVTSSFFGRMYFTAGNTIVAYTPSLYEYRYFSPIKYSKEFLIYMFPDQFIRRVLGISDRTRKLSIVMQTYYTGTWLLKDYGMEVSETSSVEVSTIGHFWMLGGYFPVFLGGIALAFVHSIIAWIIRRAWIKNPDRAVFYFAILVYAIIWTTNWDFIQICRNLLWGTIYAIVAYYLLKPFLRNFRTPSVLFTNDYNKMEML